MDISAKELLSQIPVRLVIDRARIWLDGDGGVLTW